SAVGKRERGYRRVPIAELLEDRVGQRSGPGVYFYDFAAGQVTSHIEIVNSHIQKQAAGRPQILLGGRRRIAAGDSEQLRLADFARFDHLAHLQKTRIVAAVEAYHQLYTASLHFRIDPLDPLD